MTDRSVTVEAQWALYGKTAGRERFGVLACSDLSLSSANFTEAIERFSPGTLEAPPQVTVSYAVPAGQDGESYVAIAVHNYIKSGQHGSTDDLGRPVAFTSYYCVPYQPLAEASVGYYDIYEALCAQSLPLPAKDGPPLRVTVTPSPLLAPAVDVMAPRVAALLLTGRPVCVLGAQKTSLPERLRFIDAVMGLLPYGMRSRMTAATWTRATLRNHRFRLYFSGAERDIDPPDHVVTWGQPDKAVIPPEEDRAAKYLGWLEETITHPTRNLRELTDPIGFTANQILSVLVAVSAEGTKPHRIRRTAPQPVATPQEGTPRGGQDPTEALLIECAGHVREANVSQLNRDIFHLRNAAKAGVTPAQRTRYRELITANQLFRPEKALGNAEGKLSEALLKLAFVPPLSYADYCSIEDGAGDGLPDAALVQLVDKAGLADPRVKAIVYRQLPGDEAEKKLAKWYPSKDLRAGQLLVELAALETKRPRHARLLCDVLADYLTKMRQHYDPDVIKRLLRQHSYLASRLRDSRAGDDQYQISALCSFLIAAYPNRLSRADIYHVLIGTGEPPAPTLLAAVLLTLANPEDADLARELYVFSSLTALNIAPATSREMEKLLIPGGQPPGP
jgi:hypothetical protein